LVVLAGSAASGLVWGWLVWSRLSLPGQGVRPPAILAGMLLFATESAAIGGPWAGGSVVVAAAAAFVGHFAWIRRLRHHSRRPQGTVS
jgi:hypothetical protein